jgi:hypothetical protein
LQEAQAYPVLHVKKGSMTFVQETPASTGVQPSYENLPNNVIATSKKRNGFYIYTHIICLKNLLHIFDRL